MNPENPQNTQPQPEKPQEVQTPPSQQVVPAEYNAGEAALFNVQKKIALGLGILSILIFIVGFIFGYVLVVAAVLGAYALLIGIRAKSAPIIIVGAIGTVLNVGFYILSLFVK